MHTLSFNPTIIDIVWVYKKERTSATQCSQNVDVNGPTIDASSSLCLPHSTNLWQWSEEEAMSWEGPWWGPFKSTFCEHWCYISVSQLVSQSVRQSTSEIYNVTNTHRSSLIIFTPRVQSSSNSFHLKVQRRLKAKGS